jgi:DNA-binding MarR family transcriptional regulator
MSWTNGASLKQPIVPAMTKVTNTEQYVNIADIISPLDPGDGETIGLIELLFFAYRDFVSEPDEILQEFGFGRAHHRVVHFVGRDPGMTVAQLLDILRITKQSLGRVLKELIDKGYVLQKEGENDRRQRLLHLTNAGEELRQQLMAPQIARIRRALVQSDKQAGHHYRAILYHLVSPENRESVRDWIGKASVMDGDRKGRG